MGGYFAPPFLLIAPKSRRLLNPETTADDLHRTTRIRDTCDIAVYRGACCHRPEEIISDCSDGNHSVAQLRRCAGRAATVDDLIGQVQHTIGRISVVMMEFWPWGKGKSGRKHTIQFNRR